MATPIFRWRHLTLLVLLLVILIVAFPDKIDNVTGSPLLVPPTNENELFTFSGLGIVPNVIVLVPSVDVPLN